MNEKKKRNEEPSDNSRFSNYLDQIIERYTATPRRDVPSRWPVSTIEDDDPPIKRQ